MTGSLVMTPRQTGFLGETRAIKNRLARTCSGHPRLETAIAGAKKDVDGRVKPGHSDFWRLEYGEVRMYAIGLVNGIEITVIYTDRDPNERHIITPMQRRPMRLFGRMRAPSCRDGRKL